MNICIFAGNLTRDPELKTTNGGKKVTNFSIAVNGYRKNAAGESEQDTLFLELAAWEKKAELIARDFVKGSGIMVECQAREESWDDKKTGEKRRKLKFTVTNFSYPVGGKKKAAADANEELDGGTSSYGKFPAAPTDDEGGIPF